MARPVNERIRTVLTVGGNALVRPGEEGSVNEQRKRSLELAEKIASLPPSMELILTHGNGPQVGRVLLRSDLCSDTVPPVPIDMAVSATQGQMGIMLQQAIESVAKRPAASVLTQVLVRADDPAFQNPNKFIGRFYSKEEAHAKAEALGWQIREDPGRGWRRVVASPQPLKIIEREAIDAMLKAGITVIACGGGGVPVIREDDQHVGIAAVVDKDRSSALLAHMVRADWLISLTGVDEVMVDFAKPSERPIKSATLAEMKAHLDAGQFPEGSMAPKIRSALQFLTDGGQKVIVTSPEKLALAIEGKAGTHISRT